MDISMCNWFKILDLLPEKSVHMLGQIERSAPLVTVCSCTVLGQATSHRLLFLKVILILAQPNNLYKKKSKKSKTEMTARVQGNKSKHTRG